MIWVVKLCDSSFLIPRSMSASPLSDKLATRMFIRPVEISVHGTARRSQFKEIGSMICGILKSVQRLIAGVETST